MILKELKTEALNLIKIHSTLSSLRRACSVGKAEIVPGNNKVPTLYYVSDGESESIHALNSDLVKFLVINHIETAGNTGDYAISSITANWVSTEDDYDKFVDKSYRDEHSWEESKPSMPWLVISIQKPEVESDDLSSMDESEEESDEPKETSAGKVSIKISFPSIVNLKSTVDSVGTVSEDRHSVDVQIGNYLMLEAINDMGLDGVTELAIKVESDEAIYQAVAK